MEIFVHTIEIYYLVSLVPFQLRDSFRACVWYKPHLITFT